MLLPNPLPEAIPQANAMTFLQAPPISAPITSVLVYGRKYGAATAAWTRFARSSSGQAITVAATWPAAIAASMMTSLMRLSVVVSTPLEMETKVAF